MPFVRKGSCVSAFYIYQHEINKLNILQKLKYYIYIDQRYKQTNNKNKMYTLIKSHT
jgi:hypothetical protein